MLRGGAYKFHKLISFFQVNHTYSRLPKLVTLKTVWKKSLLIV
jgi:hypothetical protein